jgi:hypothetical protein
VYPCIDRCCCVRAVCLVWFIEMRNLIKWLIEILSSLALWLGYVYSFIPSFHPLHLACNLSPNRLSCLGMTLSWKNINFRCRWLTLFIELDGLRVMITFSQICSLFKFQSNDSKITTRIYSFSPTQRWLLSLLPSLHLHCNELIVDCVMSSETALQLSCHDIMIQAECIQNLVLSLKQLTISATETESLSTTLLEINDSNLSVTLALGHPCPLSDPPPSTSIMLSARSLFLSADHSPQFLS